MFYGEVVSYEKASYTNRRSGAVDWFDRLLTSGGGILGGVLGAGVAGGGYELNMKRQKDRVEQDFKAGKIDQKECQICKVQIAHDSLLQ
jgi:hypothetical protein